MLNTLAFKFSATIETCVWLQPFGCCIFKVKSQAVWKWWVKTTQAPTLDRPPRLASLALCGTQILFLPCRTAACFNLSAKSWHQDCWLMGRRGRNISVAAAVAKGGVDLPCLTSPALLAPSPCAAHPVPAHLKLLLRRSTKVLNTSHSCWLTQSGVEST